MKIVMEIVVNTWPTKRVPWLVKRYEPHRPTLDDMPDAELDDEWVWAIIDAVLTLRPRISLPPNFSRLSLPRYYLVSIEECEGLIGAADIIGIRATIRPTKWSYLLGYWHPWCQIEIAKALKAYLKTKTAKQTIKQNYVLAH